MAATGTVANGRISSSLLEVQAMNPISGTRNNANDFNFSDVNEAFSPPSGL